MTLLAVAQINKPVVDVARPSAVGKERFRICAERAKQRRNISMVPDDQDILTVWLAFDLVDQFIELFVFELVINFETKLLGSRLYGEHRTMANPTAPASEDVVELHRLPV